MIAASPPWLARAAPVAGLGAALVLLVIGIAGGPGWAPGSDHAVLATELERSAAAPLSGIWGAALVALLPVGEPATRLAIGNAALGALTLLGVARAARALLPRDPIAAILGALLLALAPPFHAAASGAGPAMLAACGAVWAVALSLEAARAAAPRRAVGALACAGVALGAAPWLGAALAALVVGSLARAHAAHRAPLTAAAGVLGALMIAAWVGARGALPALDPDPRAAVAGTAVGAAAALVGAGLLGAAFAAVTGLRGAALLAGAIGAAAAHAAVVDPAPAAPLALLAVGAALVPGAIVRVVPPSLRTGARRHAAALAGGAPLVLVAIATGAAVRAPDPGAGPARLATDLAGELPAGPGVVATTRAATSAALRYAQRVAGARPDLQPIDADHGLVIEALRRGWLAGADTPAFGALDVRRARPRGRGFQLLADPVTAAAPVPAPATYPTPAGAREATLLALARARYEASLGRLDAAARAAGLAARLGAADLALLAVAAPTPTRPALFGFVPPLGSEHGGPWLLDLLGDDLAWVAGIEERAASAPDPMPPERALHARWRRLWRGEVGLGDPELAALGLRAVLATALMRAELGQ